VLTHDHSCSLPLTPAHYSSLPLLLSFFNVAKVKDIAKRVNGARWVEMMIDMGNHFEAFAVKTMFFNE
jgi:hypothetical protein